VKPRIQITGLAGFLLLLLPIPTVAFAQPPTASVSREPKSDKSIALSESLHATLTIEGPPPLRVELSTPLLDPLSDANWQVKETPDDAKITDISEGNKKRQRWTRTFRLSPFVPGDPVLVIFAPVKVNGDDVPVGGFDVKVVSTIAEAKPESARPVTGIEELPAPPIAPSVSWLLWVVVAVTLLALVGVVVGVRFRRRPPPLSPLAWALAAFARLEETVPSGEETVRRAAAVLREFIERRFGVPAPRLTTPELLATAEQAGWPVEETDALRLLLDRCDRAKFAGSVPDDRGCRDLLAGCRKWVHDVCAADAGPG